MDKSPTADPGHVQTVCPTLEAALQGGQQAFTRELATLLFHREAEAPVSFALVAEDPSGQPVGAVVCAPPYKLIADYVTAVPPDLRPQVEMQGLLGLSKVIGVAVDPSTRGQGVGTELVLTAEQVLSRCGTFVMYGNCAPAVAPFYQQMGFDLLPVGQPINLWVVFGFNAWASDPNMQIFSRSLRPTAPARH
jgi:GNAT superfamily N-acetyltransferase